MNFVKFVPNWVELPNSNGIIATNSPVGIVWKRKGTGSGFATTCVQPGTAIPDDLLFVHKFPTIWELNGYYYMLNDASVFACPCVDNNSIYLLLAK